MTAERSAPAPRVARHDRPVIFLVNQISRHGHLDLYARLYSACALELGYAVVLIAEHEGGVHEFLATECPDQRPHFTFLARHDLRDEQEEAADTPRPTLPARALRVARREGIGGVARRLAFYGRKPFVRVFYATLARFAWASRIRDFLVEQPHGVSFRSVGEEIRKASERLGVQPALAFFLYLDLIGEERAGRRYLDSKMKVPWGGILFHPRYDGPGSRRPERYFETGSARGAAFLNPHLLAPYRSAFPALTFGEVPDVTDASLPDARPDIVRQILERARGRPVIALLGSLGPHKGVMQFRDVVRRVDPGEFFFVMVGEIFWTTFGPDEPTLRQFVNAPPENCFVHVGYLEDERDLNAIIQASDILYAVYANQRDSSNTLTKASLLERPVIVSDKDLMGERVAAFDIGGTAPAGDIPRIVEELRRLRARPRETFGFAEYRAVHSIAALRAGFAALARAWIGEAGRHTTVPEGKR